MKKITHLTLYSVILTVFLHSAALTQSQNPAINRAGISVVNVYSYRPGIKLPQVNNGVVLGDKGWIILNYQSYAEAKKIVIKQNGKKIPYDKAIILDPERDIAALKMKGSYPVVLPVAKSNQLMKEQKVFLAGKNEHEMIFEEGVISLLHVQKQLPFQDFVEINTFNAKAVPPGGSAVLNENGELIGIVTRTRNSSQNTSYFVKIQDVLNTPVRDKFESSVLQSFLLAYKGRQAILAEKFEEAIEFYRKATDINPGRSENYNGLGYAYLFLREEEKAIENFKIAIQKDEKNIHAFNNMAAAHYYRKDIDEAIRTGLKALAIEPRNEQALNNVGGFYLDIKKFDEALKYFKLVLEITEDNANAYTNLGIVYDQMNNADQALKFYRRAIEADPNNAAVYANMARIYLNNGFLDEATRLCNKAIKLDPYFSEKTYYTLGSIQRDQGNYDLAIKNYQVAIQLSNKMSEAYYDMGKTYEIIGDRENAKNFLDKAFEINPEHLPGKPVFQPAEDK